MVGAETFGSFAAICTFLFPDKSVGPYQVHERMQKERRECFTELYACTAKLRSNACVDRYMEKQLETWKK